MRYKIKFVLILLIANTSNTTQINSSSINPKSSSSSIKLNTKTNLSIKNPITNYKGKIIKEKDSVLEGSNINFIDGTFQDNGNKINISGALTPGTTNKIILDGNKNLKSKNGIVCQSIEIQGKDNRIAGAILTSKDIELQDNNSSATFSITNELSSNINLNNGTIFLEESLKFKDYKKIIGPGKININGSNLIFGNQDLIFEENLYFESNANVELNSSMILQNKWTFSGKQNVLSTNNNIIYLDETGIISIEKGSTLTIKDAILIGVNNNNLNCSDNNGKIIFNNVTIIPNNNYNFEFGCFEVLGNLEISGPYKFTYKSTEASTIKSNSSFILDKNITFSYAPGIASQNLIVFEDKTSNLILNNATLHTTATGIQLTTGNLFINENVNLSSEKLVYYWRFINDNYTIVDGGICFGNENEEQDLICNIASNASLNIINGSFKYKNIKNSSWNMSNHNSYIKISPYCNLQLFQNLNLKNGTAEFQKNAILSKIINKNLIGSINAKGKFIKGRL